MTFEYIGVRSLRDPAVFQQILVSSVENTGLANDFEIRGDLKNVDVAFDDFQQFSFKILTSRKIRETQQLLGLSALAIYCVSLHKIFSNDQVYFVDDGAVGLHAAAVRKNPNELIALTFGLAIIEIHAAAKESTTGLVRTPAKVRLKAVSARDIRRSIHIIATNRNNSLRTGGGGQYWPTFWHLSRLMLKIRSSRLDEWRQPT